jgi:hypothetical protein
MPSLPLGDGVPPIIMPDTSEPPSNGPWSPKNEGAPEAQGRAQMSRAGQRARLDKLLEAIGPKIQRIRVEGGMPPAGAPAGSSPVETMSKNSVKEFKAASFAELNAASDAAAQRWLANDPKTERQAAVQERMIDLAKKGVGI